MSDNYPPGVTGLEPQITGPSEVLSDEECGEPLVDAIPAHAVLDEIDLLHSSVRFAARQAGADAAWHRAEWERQERRISLLVETLKELRAEVEWPEGCPGATDTVTESNGALHWTCPACGADHEREIE